ncbi:MAG: hypothetical protein J6K92_00960 [Oscillospiraceae bacterium]|nr:hypothetical protein [Oscillospiraceae bacterium]
MPDFSDRYKKALEYQEISPDFKERTAKLMTELRDSEELVPKTAEDEPMAASFTVSDNEEKFPRRIKIIKVISAMAAAAACLTVGVALNRAGVFDRDNEPAVVNSDSIVTEATDIMETSEEQTLAGAADGDKNEYSSAENRAALEHGSETDETAEKESDNGAENAPAVGAAAFTMEETSPLIEEAAPEEAAAFSETEPALPNAAEDIQGYEEIIEDVPDHDGAVPAEAAPSQSENTAPAETVLMLAPFSEESDEIADEEMFDDETEEDIEEAPTDETPSAAMSRSSDFSPRRAVAGFPAQTSSALITPSFEDNISEDGTVVKYQAKRIRSVTKLLELNKELYAYTEEDSAAVGDASPTDSRYIIDYAGDQGNAMRIYIGSRYICFAYEGGYYTYELTEEEYKKLDSSLFGLVS